MTAYLRALRISDARIGVMEFSVLTLSQANVLLFSLVNLFGRLQLFRCAYDPSIDVRSAFHLDV